MKKDIFKEQVYVEQLILVMKSYISPKKIPLCVPRRSDAFVYILNGCCKYEFDDGESFTAKAGNILYLAKGAVYKMEIYERYDFICADFFFACPDARKSCLLSPKDSREVENTFFKLLHRFAESPSNLSETMTLLYAVYSAAARSRETNYLSTDTRARILGARSRILREFTSPDLTVAVLAVEARMSEAHFRAGFKELFGSAPSVYINECRIARAKELLLLNYLSLEEIAESCGFSSASYLCRVFKKHTGQTTAQYRQGHFRIFDT